MDADNSMAEVVSRRAQAGKAKTRPLPVALLVLVCLVAACVGCLVGTVFLGGDTAATTSRSDGAVASFTYQGEAHDIGQDDLQKLGIGYSVPEGKNYDSADVLVAVRMRVLSQEARSRGISVTDEDVSSFAQSLYQTVDYASLGQGVLDAQAVKTALEQRLLVKRLQDEITPGEPIQPSPAAPDAPVGGPQAESVPSAEYGAYLVDLFGEAYDVESSTWVQLDSPFYEAFKDESFSADGATFEQALKAYSVANAQYASSASRLDDTWTNYVGEVLSGVEVVLYGFAV